MQILVTFHSHGNNEESLRMASTGAIPHPQHYFCVCVMCEMGVMRYLQFLTQHLPRLECIK